jgi:hypothetical protein
VVVTVRARQIEGGGLGVHEIDPVILERRGEREGDVGGAALAEREPDERGVEHEPVRGRDHPDIHVTLQFMVHRQRRGQPPEIPAQHKHLVAAHRRPPPLRSPGIFAQQPKNTHRDIAS